MSTTEQKLRETIRAAGGIVHGDGNIFFTNPEQFGAAALAATAKPVMVEPSDAEIIALADAHYLGGSNVATVRLARAILARWGNAATAEASPVVDSLRPAGDQDFARLRMPTHPPVGRGQGEAEPNLIGANPIDLTPPMKELQRQQYQRLNLAQPAVTGEAEPAGLREAMSSLADMWEQQRAGYSNAKIWDTARSAVGICIQQVREALASLSPLSHRPLADGSVLMIGRS